MVDVELKSLLGRLNRSCTRGLEGAAGLCVGRGHYEVTVEHTLAKLLEDPGGDLAAIVARLELEPAQLQRSLLRALDDLRTGNPGKPVFSPLLLEWIQDGWVVSSLELGLAQIRSAGLMVALAGNPRRYLSGDHPELKKLTVERLRREMRAIINASAEEAQAASAAAPGPPGAPAAARGDSALARFATNFTAQARAGKMDPVFGRDAEIRQAIDILARRRKNNPIVVGDAGVGKTAIVEGLALRIAEGDVPDLLKNVEIWGLDMGLLQAGAGVKGEFENRLKGVIEEVKANTRGIILFIDEVHTLIGAGGAAGTADAANLLKPALARGEMRTVGATTWMEYKKYFEEDPALARRFQAVKVEEPSPESAAVMLRGLKVKYEEAHKVTVRDDAIAAAAHFSARYIAGRQLPDKAVDLLDTAAARVKIAQSAKPGPVEDLERRIQALDRELAAIERDRAGGVAVDEEAAAERVAEREKTAQELAVLVERWTREKAAVTAVLEARAKAAEEGGKAALDAALAALKEIQGRDPLIPVEVDPEVVAQVVGDWTGVPVGKMVQDEATQVLRLEETLRKRIKGQDHALAAIARVLRGAKAGLRDPGKPLGVFLLVGPSGVGKTETALAVADVMFGGERFLTSINMSEYQDREMGVSGLVGAKPGYVGYGKGGTLTEGVRQRPYSVVLLDEIEKACQEVRNLFFQVFDKGDLTDGTGRTIDFKNTVIFITSNLASDAIQALCAASPAPDSEEILAAVRPTLSKALQPAWLARTTLVPFFSLQGPALAEITALKIGKVQKRLKQTHRVDLVYGQEVIDQIAARCQEVETGARNIDFILDGTLLPRISAEILGRLAEGPLPGRLTLGLDADGLFTLEFA